MKKVFFTGIKYINKKGKIKLIIANLLFLIARVLFYKSKINLTINNGNVSKNINNINIKFEKYNCYSFPDGNIKILHLVLTRFLVKFFFDNGFPNKIYNKDYISNGIRVMNKYLLPSLENQSCKNFTWVLLLGDEANLTNIQSLMNFNYSFKMKVIFLKDLKQYIKKITRGFEILITTRIDYDDRIYYDAVNDVRKAINIYKPIQIHGYNRGAYFNELEGKYYDYYRIFQNNTGVWSIFISLIIVLNRVNDTYNIFDIGNHGFLRKNIIEKYKSYGINQLNYEPTIFDSGSRKFVWVRQKYSGTHIQDNSFEKNIKTKLINFSLNKFYGKI